MDKNLKIGPRADEKFNLHRTKVRKMRPERCQSPRQPLQEYGIKLYET